jgi:hypothetical protein
VAAAVEVDLIGLVALVILAISSVPYSILLVTDSDLTA